MDDLHGAVESVAGRSGVARVKEEEAEWHAFTGLPGTHARWRAAGKRKELVSTEGQVLVILQPPSELVVENRIYEWRRDGKRPQRPNLYRTPLDLVDALTGQQMLRIENRPEGRSRVGQVQTPTHSYTFPVRGERQHFATMSAVDERESVASRSREAPGRRFSLKVIGDIEIAISPNEPASVELCCLMGVSLGFIWEYFNRHYPH